MDSVCFLCKESARKGKASSTTWYFLFSKRGKQLNLNHKIQFTLGLEDDEGTITSGRVCRTCYHRVEQFYDFKVKCLRTLGLLHDDETQENTPSKQPPSKRHCRRPLFSSPSAQQAGTTQINSQNNLSTSFSSFSTILSAQPFSTPSQTNRAPLGALSQNLAFPLNTPISISQNNASLDSNKQSEQQIHYEETMVQQANESSNRDQQPPSAINLTVSASSDDINNANQETQNNSQESRKETIIKNMLEKRARIGSGNHNNVSNLLP